MELMELMELRELRELRELTIRLSTTGDELGGKFPSK